MNSAALGLIYSIVIVVLAGRLVFSVRGLAIDEESSGIKLPLYYLMGTVVLSLYMLLLFFFRIRFSAVSISLPFIIYAIFYLFRYGRSFSPALRGSVEYVSQLCRSAQDRKNIWQTLGFAAISVVVFIVFLQNITVPVFIGDSYAHWFIKAKAIFVKGTIPSDILTNMDYFYTRTDYPLLAPLNLAWTVICTGGWSDTITRTLFSFYYLAMIVFFYHSLKNRMGEKSALCGTFILSLIPNVLRETTDGYTDICVAVLVMASLILLLEWFINRENTGRLLLSSLFMGGAAWTKNDGIGLFAVASVTLLLFLASKMKSGEVDVVSAASKFFAYLVCGCIVFLPFKIFVASQGIGNHMIGSLWQMLSLTGNLWRAPYILNQFLYEFFLNTNIWLYFWIFFFLMLIIRRKQAFKSDARYILLFMLLYSALLFYIYMVTTLGSTIEGLKSNLEELERLLLHITPIAVFYAFVLLEDKKRT